MMRRITRAGVCMLALVSAGLAGCTTRAGQLWVYPHRHEETLTMTKEEHNQAVIRIADQDRRALVDDLDLVFMTDRPTRLTRWHTP